MTPNGSGMGVRKNFKLLKYEHIIYSFEARNLGKSHWGVIKPRNQNIFEKFKLNRNLQMTPFKMMYDMSMLRHRFSNKRGGGGGGGGGALNHLPLYSVKVCS